MKVFFFLASRNSAYNLNSCVPGGLDPDCCSSFIATSSGARLTVPGSGVAVTVPEGSLTRGQKEEVTFLDSLNLSLGIV